MVDCAACRSAGGDGNGQADGRSGITTPAVAGGGGALAGTQSGQCRVARASPGVPAASVGTSRAVPSAEQMTAYPAAVSGDATAAPK